MHKSALTKAVPPTNEVASAASLALHTRATRTAPGGVQGAARYWRPYPLYFDRASQGHIWDVDGNEFVDLWAAAGPIVLGHNDGRVLDPTLERVRRAGTLLCLPHEREVLLAETLCDIYPGAEMVAYGCGGSDVLLFALRAARAYTGKQKIVKCEGAYHGWNDAFLVSVRPNLADAGPAEKPVPVPESTGLARDTAADCIVVHYNDLAGIQRVLDEQGEHIAAVVVEPVFHTVGCITPDQGYLEGIREACDAAGVVLIFDEIITGVRHALGGYQSISGVTPDLTALGKAMSNGFPISALVGRREVMEVLTPIGDAYYSGTFMGQSLLVEAALATIEVLSDGSIHDRLFNLGEMLATRVVAAIDETGAEATFAHFGSVWALYFGTSGVSNYRDVAALGYPNDVHTVEFRAFLRANGFYFHPTTTRAYLMDAHGDAEIDRLASLIETFLVSRRDDLKSRGGRTTVPVTTGSARAHPDAIGGN
jgi:glutamate-1-semialdehyde 2,1-aminomutase